MDRSDPQLPIQFTETTEPASRVKLAKILDRARERQEREAIAAGLPEWPEKARGIPNGALRSSMFGVVRKGARDYLKRQKIASVDGLTLIFNGPRLTQYHLDVWEQCLHIARVDGTGKIIRFTAYSFLKSIGRSTGKSDREWLKGALLDLASSVVEVTDGRKAYFGPLIHHGVRDEVTKEYIIEINPRLALLYGVDGWTRVEFAQRQALRKQPLAQWLHGFYSTHANPYPYKVETLRRLCGSETKELFHFRAELRDALAKLAEATGWSWAIDPQDLVRVLRRGGIAPMGQGDSAEHAKGRTGDSADAVR